MRRNHSLDMVVGLFILSGMVAFILLALKVSGLQDFSWRDDPFLLKANFANVGGLKQRSRVSIAGVNIGKVNRITLDSDESYDAVVEMSIKSNLLDKIPEDSIASIRTSGLIGDNFINIEPGGSEVYLRTGQSIGETHSALVLEELISKYLFSKTEEAGDDDEEEEEDENGE